MAERQGSPSGHPGPTIEVGSIMKAALFSSNATVTEDAMIALEKCMAELTRLTSSEAAHRARANYRNTLTGEELDKSLITFGSKDSFTVTKDDVAYALEALGLDAMTTMKP